MIKKPRLLIVNGAFLIVKLIGVEAQKIVIP